MKFRHHNVKLGDGTRTSKLQPMEDRSSVKQAVSLLQDHLDSGDSILDLGCLEGGYSVEIARAMPQSSVTGVEVRKQSFDLCCRLPARCRTPNLEFINEDALDTTRTADGVFCGGLLYHLENPVSFLYRLKRMANKFVVINTHYSVKFGPQFHKLSELSEHEESQGRWYTEYPDDASFRDRENYPLSAWDNRRSFWLLRDEITSKMKSIGFSNIDTHGVAIDRTGYNRTTITARTN